MVERLTLRMVQIRDGSGSLVTISHSSATSVVNHSRNWSRVDYAVSIDPAVDVERAIELIRTASINCDRKELVGAASSIPSNGSASRPQPGRVIIRARIKTAPLRQFALQRELNFRIATPFAKPTSASVPPLRLDASDQDDLDAGLEVLANGRPPLDRRSPVLAGNHSAEHRIAVVVRLALAIKPRVVPEVDIELRRSGVGAVSRAMAIVPDVLCKPVVVVSSSGIGSVGSSFSSMPPWIISMRARRCGSSEWTVR